jgi:hypothetical protein
LQDTGGTCPFSLVVPLTGREVVPPCDECDFADVSDACAEAINSYCEVAVIFGEEACLGYLEYTLGSNCIFGGNFLPLSIPDTEAALEQGIQQGRDGNGIIYVFASGNTYGQGGDASQQWYLQNNRYTISVGAVGQDGLHAPYSTSGELGLNRRNETSLH